MTQPQQGFPYLSSGYTPPSYPVKFQPPQGVINRRPVSTSAANRATSAASVPSDSSSRPPLSSRAPERQSEPTITEFYGPGRQSNEQPRPSPASNPPLSIHQRLIPPQQSFPTAPAPLNPAPTPTWSPPLTASPPYQPPPAPSPSPQPSSYPYLSIYTRLLPSKRRPMSLSPQPSSTVLVQNNATPPNQTVSPPTSPPAPTPTITPHTSSPPGSLHPSISPPTVSPPVFTPIIPQPPSPVLSIDALEASPGLIDCPFCHARAPTRVEKHNGKATKKVAAYMSMLAIVGAVLPYAFHWCQDLAHFCSTCGEKVATRRYDLDSLTLQGAERCAPPLPPRPDVTVAEMGGSDVGELEGEFKAMEIDGFVRYEAEGAPAVAEMDAGQDGVGRFEMEHVNRGVGTQKRIKRALETAPPLPPLPMAVPQDLGVDQGDDFPPTATATVTAPTAMPEPVSATASATELPLSETESPVKRSDPLPSLEVSPPIPQSNPSVQDAPSPPIPSRAPPPAPDR